MALVDEHRTDRARTGVHVFVGAPRRGVDFPVVQRQRNIARRVGEVPDHVRSNLVGCLGDPGDVEELPGAERDAGEEDAGERVPEPLDRGDGFIGREEPCGVRGELHDRRRRVEPVHACMARRGVAVGGEGTFFGEQDRPCAMGPVEGEQEKVHVDGERVGGNHLAPVGSDDAGQGCDENLGLRGPRPIAGEVTFDRIDAPTLDDVIKS